MPDQVVIAGPASQGLAVKLATILNARVVSTENKVFPDGECYLRIDIKDDAELNNKDVIIVQTTGGSAQGNQNQHIMELIMMISAAKRCKAAKVRVVVPYFAYSRQDKNFRPGESVFANEICRWIEAAGATEFYSIDIHAEQVLEAFSIPAFNLDPMEALAKEIKKRGLKDPIVVCPDKGAYERSRSFAKFLGNNVPIAQFSKKRDVKTGEVSMQGEIDVNVANKEVIIADDIIATGGTMSLAIGIAKNAGAKAIYAIGTHPLLISTAVFKLMSAGTTEIIGTDTLDSTSMQASMAEVIAKAIKR
jgi:ribose-phosphate pyrophosphokinase